MHAFVNDYYCLATEREFLAFPFYLEGGVVYGI